MFKTVPNEKVDGREKWLRIPIFWQCEHTGQTEKVMRISEHSEQWLDWKKF